MTGYDVVASSRLADPARKELNGLEFLERPADRADPYEWSLEVLSGHGARVYITVFSRVDAELLRKAKGLELVITTSSGYDHIDVKTAEELGVCVANQPEAIAEAVAEYVVAAILASLRQIVRGHIITLSGSWYEGVWPGRQGGLIIGRRVGILGMGRIGSLVAHKLSALGASEIVYWSRSRVPRLESIIPARSVESLEELFRESDVVVNLLPLTSETRGLVRWEHFKIMKPGSVFVNAGRGATVKEEDLVKAIEERRDIRFVLDVHAEEPLPPEHPIVRAASKLENVILTPHIAGASRESFLLTHILAARQAKLYLETGSVWNPVNVACRASRTSPPTLNQLIKDLSKHLGPELGGPNR